MNISIIKTIRLAAAAIFLPAFLGALPCEARDVPDDEEDPYFLLAGEASRAIDSLDYETAAARLREAIAMRPDSPENVLLMSNLGMVYSYMDKDSLALKTLSEALAIAPSMKTVLTNRARVYLKNGRNREAYADLNRVIDADSANVEARYLHGLLSLGAKDLSIAEADFRVVADAAPDETSTAVCMSALFTAQGRHKEATPYLRKLVSDIGEADDYAALAQNLLDLEELTEASKTIGDGLKKYPDSGELYFCRARLNRDRYSYKEAKEDAAKASSLGIERARIKTLGL